MSETPSVQPTDAAPARSAPRWGLIASVVTATAVVIGAGTWAAVSFLGEGPDPAAALPAGTIAFASVELDPSGSQKVEAVRMLRKFPAVREQIGSDEDADVREQIFEDLVEDGDCADLEYAKDVEPWLGTTFAVGGFAAGDADPAAFAAIAVKDAEAATRTLERLAECGDRSGVVVREGWAYLAEDAATAKAVADGAESDPLSEDATYREWTDRVGDPGIARLYAAPEAGRVLADQLSGIADVARGDLETAGPTPGFSPRERRMLRRDMIRSGLTPRQADRQLKALTESLPPIGTMPEDSFASGMQEHLDELTAAYADFEGGAATVRFADEGLEVEAAFDALATPGLADLDPGDAGAIAASLPEDTLATLALAPGEGTASTLLDGLFAGMGDQMLTAAEAQTGLDLPGDLDTLLGEGFAIALGAGFDPTAVDDPSEAPVALKVQGDPDAIGDVVAKVQRQQLTMAGQLSTEPGDGTYTLGGDPAYVKEVSGDGALGDSDAYRQVVPDADGAAAVLYVDFDGGDWLAGAVGNGDEEARASVEPLSALGLTASREDGVDRVRVRLTTD